MSITPRPGRYAITTVARDSVGRITTSAALNRVARSVENYFAPINGGSVLVPYALVRLSGIISSNLDADNNTLALPLLSLTQRLSDASLTVRNRIRSVILDRFGANYSYIDYQGAVRPVSGLLEVRDTDTFELMLRNIFGHLQHSRRRDQPSWVETHNTEYTDDFSTDPSTRWTQEIGTYTWDSANGELEVNTVDGNLEYYFRNNNSPGSIEHECVGMMRVSPNDYDGWQSAVAVRGASSGGVPYNLEPEPAPGTGGSIYLMRGSSTILATYAVDVDTSDYWTFRLAAEGVAGANVLLSVWYQNEGATKPATDPGWIGADGSPNQTYTDTSASRLDASTDNYCGIAGYVNTAYDEQFDYWRTRAISDRAGTVISVSDTGSGTENLSIASSLSISDAGSGADAGPAPAVSFSLQDTGVGNDAESVVISLAVQDSGSGADSAALAEILNLISDTAVGSDQVANINASFAITDNAIGQDSPALSIYLPVTDAGTGSDAISVVQEILRTITDQGQGSDNLNVTVSVPISDSGAGIDAVALQALLQVIDSAQGQDVVVRFDAGIRIAKISFSLQRRSIAFSYSSRSLNFTLQKRSVSFSLI